VTQDDVLFAHLTVKETLTYAALLLLPKTMTKQQKEERAMDVIYELGLDRYTCPYCTNSSECL
jgi:ABC-type multidrug transport system ATPase subunit